LANIAFDKATAFLSRWNTPLDTTEQRINSAISTHLKGLKNWSREVAFKDLQRPRSLSEVFVPLDIYLLPRRNRLSGDENLRSVPLDGFLSNSDEHLVILGQPGAGKTTCVKHICEQLLTSDSLSSTQDFPILIQLRDLNSARTPQSIEDCSLITERLQTLFDIPFSPPSEGSSATAFDLRSARQRVVLEVIEATRPLILLDGLDEITLKRKRDAVIEELRRLAPMVENARFILTSRTGEFNYYLERMHSYEIAPLTEQQIEEFVSGWLGDDASKVFLAQIRRSPFWDAAIKPLTLAHLCAIFERYNSIPERPKYVYKKIVKLLLEEWDQQRSVKRASAYAGFDVDRKQDFLADIAHALTLSRRGTTFSRSDLLDAYEEVFENYGMSRGDAQAVVDEIESHTGIVVQSASDLFEFSHKSLQEYLTALFIYGLPNIPPNMIEMQIMPSELAIATALSSRPAKYFTRLVIDHFRKYHLSFAFIRTYISRLLIEHPDFENDTEVGVALLLLYSQYLQTFIAEADQLKLFIDDYLEDEFAQLGAMIRTRILLQEVLRIYDVYTHSYSGIGEQIWRLERKTHPSGSFSLMARSNLLPKTLWIRNSLLSPAGIKVEDLDHHQSPS
jgi:energy-coupling factor transporter ATP-binding protein EcfA2